MHYSHAIDLIEACVLGERIPFSYKNAGLCLRNTHPDIHRMADCFLITKDYLLPNDEKEQNRLDLYHHMTKLLLDGKLHLAPIGSNPQRILDLGTGTGIWAIDMGQSFFSPAHSGLLISKRLTDSIYDR